MHHTLNFLCNFLLFSILSKTVLIAGAFGNFNSSKINMEEDELEWSIGEDLTFDDPEFLLEYDLMEMEDVFLKSGQK